MDFVEFFDDATIRDIHVSGIARIERISSGMVRVTEYVEFSNSDGSPDRRAISHRVMDFQTLVDMQLQSTEIMRILRATPANGHREDSRTRRVAN